MTGPLVIQLTDADARDAARAAIGVAKRGSTVCITPPKPTTTTSTGEQAMAAPLTADPVAYAAALVMARPIDQRMAAFVDVASVYLRALIDQHPQASKIDLREASRAFGFAVLHRLQTIVPGDIDGWME